tara:strand:- start:273 stop:587 length:315 start_codon:yes stop_codon:yes gene_type:complete
MNKYLTQIEAVDYDVFHSLGDLSQKTIDLVQETLEHLDRDYNESPVERDELGAINYELDVLLEIWDKNLKDDIAILNRLNKIIHNWYIDVEFINNSLGIPKHKG